MAKKKDELKEEVTTEVTEITAENTAEKAEISAEVEEKTENVENNVEEIVENVEEEKEIKLPTVKTSFRDKYDRNVVYNPGDVFIESVEIKDNKPCKVEDGKYKVSMERIEELKRSQYVD